MYYVYLAYSYAIPTTYFIYLNFISLVTFIYECEFISYDLYFVIKRGIINRLIKIDFSLFSGGNT